VSDLNDKVNERWQQRRKKGYNWPKLIVMLLILVAIFYAMNMLQNGSNVQGVPMAETTDSSTVEIPAGEMKP